MRPLARAADTLRTSPPTVLPHPRARPAAVLNPHAAEWSSRAVVRVRLRLRLRAGGWVGERGAHVRRPAVGGAAGVERANTKSKQDTGNNYKHAITLL